MPWSEHVYQYDGQGNTTALVDETSTVTDTFTYDAWGNEVARTGTTKTPFRWNGRVGYYWDEDTGTIQVRRRPYEPRRGQWLTVDLLYPFGNDSDAYHYVDNSPVSLEDPSGEEPLLPENADGLCPDGCKCDFDHVTWECARALQAQRKPKFQEYTVGKHSPIPGWARGATFEIEIFALARKNVFNDGCCGEDIQYRAKTMRCFRKPLLNCPGKVKNDRSAPWNEILAVGIFVEKTNRECQGIGQLPDEEYLYLCPRVIGVLASTPGACLAKWAPENENNTELELCSMIRRMPWGEAPLKDAVGGNPAFKCPG